MKKLFFILLLLVLIPVALLAYLGFVPGISSVLAKPKDLGKVADPALVTAFESKYKNPSSPTTALDVTLSDTEITSVFAVWETRDVNFPLHSVQVRFNPDGTGEASGYLKIATAINLAKNLGYSDADISKGKDYLKYVSGDLPFYVKGTGGMTNNVLAINPATFELGRVTVPESITTPASKLVGDMINRRLKQIGGADIKEANFNSGQFRLVGTVPSTINY